MARRPPAPEGAGRYLPRVWTAQSLRDAVQHCRGCPLYDHATQAVFGEGREGATLLFVGEQPGDEEDRQGRPFIGPAGRELNRALMAAGIPREEVFVTNAVKHFKFKARGARRLHVTPTSGEVRACRPWLLAELELVRPVVLVLLGATAAKALLGPAFRVTAMRGVPLDTPWAESTFATVHPSSVLRVPSEAQRDAAREAFQADLTAVATTWRRLLRSGAPTAGRPPGGPAN